MISVLWVKAKDYDALWHAAKDWADTETLCGAEVKPVTWRMLNPTGPRCEECLRKVREG